MEQINLPEFLSLFGCTSVNDCWLNTDCVIDESGIKTRHIANHSDEDYIERINYSQRVKLSFPCTAQQIFDWAQLLDSWEKFNAVGNQNHVVEKLPKEIVDKWQPVNELYRGWCDAKGVIKEKIGTEPFDVNWGYWLSLPRWTNKQAALLVSGLEPDKFHLVERLADYESMCEPLVKLLRQIPDDLTQCPFDWLNWFAEIGYLEYAKKPLLVWFEQQSGIVAQQTQAGEDDDAGSQVTTEPVRVNTAPTPWLVHDPKDPEPKYPWYTPARYFARQLVTDDSTLLTKPNILTDKIVKSLTKAGFMKRGGKKPFDPVTIKKALVNVNLG